MAELKTQVNTNPGQGFLPAKAGGPEKRKKRDNASEYKKSLVEKQTLKRMYGLSEKQFKRYVKDALSRIQKVTNVSDELIKVLEKRLDNVVYRAGFAKTRAQARQLVNHSFFSIDGKGVDIPSYSVKKGDVISLKENKKKKLVFEGLSDELKKAQPHAWLKLDKEKVSVKVEGEPSLAEVNPPVEISLIFEFYSR